MSNLVYPKWLQKIGIDLMNAPGGPPPAAKLEIVADLLAIIYETWNVENNSHGNGD